MRAPSSRTALRLKLAAMLLVALATYYRMSTDAWRFYDLRAHHNDQYNLLTTVNCTPPYIHPMPRLPSRIAQPQNFLLERITGILIGTPFLWMIALGLLVLWIHRRRASPCELPRLELTWLLVSIVVVVVTILSTTTPTMRYLADFAALFDLVAIVVWFYVDQRLAAAPGWRRWTRGVGMALILIGAIIGLSLPMPPPHHYMDG